MAERKASLSVSYSSHSRVPLGGGGRSTFYNSKQYKEKDITEFGLEVAAWGWGSSGIEVVAEETGKAACSGSEVVAAIVTGSRTGAGIVA